MKKPLEIEVGKIKKDGAMVYTVRVTEGGELAIKGHFNTPGEAKMVAEEEAKRLGVEVTYPVPGQ